MNITPNRQRLRIKEIICEKPESIVTNIRFYDKRTGEEILSCNEGAFCFGRNDEIISLTFPEGNLYIEKQGENYFLIKEEIVI